MQNKENLLSICFFEEAQPCMQKATLFVLVGLTVRASNLLLSEMPCRWNKPKKGLSIKTGALNTRNQPRHYLLGYFMYDYDQN